MFKTIKKIKKIIIFIATIFLILTIGIILLTTNYPIGYKSMIVEYSKEYDLDPYLVASIINVESKYDKDAISQKGARGLMQISPSTGKWASEVLGIDNYSEDILFDPETNIRIGTWYLDTLFKEFDYNLELVLAAYNAGSGNVSKWLKDEKYSNDRTSLSIIPFKETEDYLVRVNQNYKVYSTLYKKYIMNPSDKDSLYINLLHNIRKIIKEIIRNV
ncbi:lytic transglycosylase domain-containing protein [Tissierella carlieri]|uniref:Lytic transglycosylase domain-containing protein n=1 Tax=Tissierella carlieri TaxID=689904 RepID=A0ABT1SB76_9FIRM|nr:lytic transglycosylase domain-containing protein [Tissierella carlieri]MBU5311189.1 lytic transglycosylase domain-containing protein [Tissierella carlieri]MCQ4923699.1 lytic transglycosylase domain-containing protein [Tissierella carlieri]